MLNLPASLSPAGTAIAPGHAGSVLVVPDRVGALESCGYRCVKPQSCVTPWPLACGRLVREGSSARFEITATGDSYKGSRHHGITGLGTVAALSKALKLKDDNKQLEAAVEDV